MTVLEFRAVDVPRDTQLLRDLNPDDLRLILRAARTRRFSAKSVITHQGEAADHLLLLWRGRARCFFDTPNWQKLIQIGITPGHILVGPARVSRPWVYLVRTQAVQDCHVLVCA